MTQRNDAVRVLTTAAMLTAISIVIGIFCKNFLSFGPIRITFEHFPMILAGIMLGPVIGGCVGVASDILSYFLSTQSFAISPIVTLGSALVGVIAGLVSHRIIKKDNLKRIILSVFFAHLIGTMTVKTWGLFGYFGWLVLWRIPLYIAIAALEATVIVAVYRNKVIHTFMVGRR